MGGGGLSQRIIAAWSERLEIEEGGVEMRRGTWKQEVRKVKAALVLSFFFFAPEAQELHSLGGAANGAYFLGISQRRHI